MLWGLGMGLPLSIELGKLFETIEYDANPVRIAELLAGYDKTDECSADDLKSSNQLSFSSDISGLSACNIFS